MNHNPKVNKLINDIQTIIKDAEPIDSIVALASMQMILAEANDGSAKEVVKTLLSAMSGQPVDETINALASCLHAVTVISGGCVARSALYVVMPDALQTPLQYQAIKEHLLTEFDDAVELLTKGQSLGVTH